jgi:hypothetical protein
MYKSEYLRLSWILREEGINNELKQNATAMPQTSIREKEPL